MSYTGSYYQKSILGHYVKAWKGLFSKCDWYKGPKGKINRDFTIFEFAPSLSRNMWTYATCCMSKQSDAHPIEIHMFSSERDIGIVELLTALVYYHQNTNPIGLHHTVNFGRPWQSHSLSSHGFVSFPYLDGPELENFEFEGKVIKFYSLVPITENEKDYKIKYGVDALEQIFDRLGLDYVNPSRASLI